MTVWIPFVLLWTLAVVDGGFAGFRSAAGRSGHIFKDAYYRAAIRRGLKYGMGTTLVIGAAAAVIVFVAPSPSSRLLELAIAARALLWILGTYATLVLLAVGVWSVAEVDLRTFASVIILGPLTLIRPWAILAAGAWAAHLAPSAVVSLLAVAAVVLQLCVEPLLDRGPFLHH